MSPAPDDLLRVTTSLIDSSSDDWAVLEQHRKDVDPDLLRELKVLAGIAEFHRTLHVEATRHARSEWGHLALRGELGSGSFGSVYRAWDPALEREVALKLYRVGPRDATLDLLLAEGRLLARVRHPNVVIVHGVDQRGDEVGLWLELIDGRTLAEEVRVGGPLGFREAALVGLDLCRALAAVHQAGLLHRDVKPQNVMRERGGRIVLMDFGLGRHVSQSLPPTTDAGGTPLYMAPELFAGGSASTVSDVYSLGVLLFFLVTDTHPVTAASRTELERAHRQGRRRHLSDVRPDLPDAFAQVIDRACAGDPAQRFQTAGAMQAAIAGVLGLQGTDHRQSRASGWSSAWSRIALATAAGLVLLAGLLFVRDRPANVSDGGTSGVAVTGPAGPVHPIETEYRIEAGFHRVGDAGSEKLSPGQRVRPGDLLFLDLRASKPVHVYVVTQDERGESYLLFPLPGQALANPLGAERTHRLPGQRSGEDTYWEVTSAGGREHLLIVASPEPLTPLEAVFATLPKPVFGRPVTTAVPLAQDVVGQLRGIGGLRAQPARSSPSTSLIASVLSLKPEPESISGPWMRQFTLENPSR